MFLGQVERLLANEPLNGVNWATAQDVAAYVPGSIAIVWIIALAMLAPARSK